MTSLTLTLSTCEFPTTTTLSKNLHNPMTTSTVHYCIFTPLYTSPLWNCWNNLHMTGRQLISQPASLQRCNQIISRLLEPKRSWSPLQQQYYLFVLFVYLVLFFPWCNDNMWLYFVWLDENSCFRTPFDSFFVFCLVLFHACTTMKSLLPVMWSGHVDWMFPISVT